MATHKRSGLGTVVTDHMQGSFPRARLSNVSLISMGQLGPAINIRLVHDRVGTHDKYCL